MDNQKFTRVSGGEEMIAAPLMSEHQLVEIRKRVCYGGCVYRGSKCNPIIEARNDGWLPNTKYDLGSYVLTNATPYPLSRIGHLVTASIPFSDVPEGCTLVNEGVQIEQ